MGDILQPPGRTISYFPELTKVTGSIKAAILCQQVTYWTTREDDADTWIDKLERAWLEETGFTLKEFRGACESLEHRKLIERVYDRANHTLKIRLLVENYNAAIQALGCGSKLKVAHSKRAHAKKAPPKTAHAKRAHAQREDSMLQKGTWQVPKGDVLDDSPIKDSYESRKADLTTEGTTKETTPENAHAFSSSSPRGDGPETDTSTDPPETHPPNDAHITIDEIVDGWNEICGSEGMPMKTDVGRHNASFRKNVKRSILAHSDREFWQRVLNNAWRTPWSNGSATGWKATLHWVVENEVHLIKVYEAMP